LETLQFASTLYSLHNLGLNEDGTYYMQIRGYILLWSRYQSPPYCLVYAPEPGLCSKAGHKKHRWLPQGNVEIHLYMIWIYVAV